VKEEKERTAIEGQRRRQGDGGWIEDADDDDDGCGRPQ